ncbi:hypothetical protein SNE40_007627 [Patella caerulea]|uniref:Uncharacterized protein n=1 Tax=Patella caerulea TaxID=87958 RepID=A0AAN8JZD5_PATCE
MPSFWKCFCMPNRRTRMRSERRKWQNLNIGSAPSLSIQSSKHRLLDNSDPSCYDSDVIIPPVVDSWSRMQNQPGVKKRKKLDEIFECPKPDPFQTSGDSYHLKSIGFPCMVAPHLESMYGYTPRAVQDIYASSALEGGAVEDYFTECRNDKVLDKFATAERCNTNLETNTVTNIVHSKTEDRRKKYIVDSEGDLSSSESEMDVTDFPELFQNTKYHDVWPNVNGLAQSTESQNGYMCQSEFRGFQNQHFDEIFGGDGEVLY